MFRTIPCSKPKMELWEEVGRSYPPKPEPHYKCENEVGDVAWISALDLRKKR